MSKGNNLAYNYCDLVGDRIVDSETLSSRTHTTRGRLVPVRIMRVGEATSIRTTYPET